jgi:hypothetical protein
MNENPYKSPQAETPPKRPRAINRLPPPQWMSYFYVSIMLIGLVVAVVVSEFMSCVRLPSAP